LFESARSRRWFCVAAVAALAACEDTTGDPPAFAGRETPAWRAYEFVVAERSDVLEAFEAASRAMGCRVDRLGASDVGMAGEGSAREWYGITAHCGDDGTVAIITLTRDRVRVGCAKPMARDRCDALFERIAEAR
jgi:hypothetical protein